MQNVYTETLIIITIVFKKEELASIFLLCNGLF